MGVERGADIVGLGCYKWRVERSPKLGTGRRGWEEVCGRRVGADLGGGITDGPVRCERRDEESEGTGIRLALPNRAQPLQSRDRKKVQIDLKRNTHPLAQISTGLVLWKYREMRQ